MTNVGTLQHMIRIRAGNMLIWVEIFECNQFKHPVSCVDYRWGWGFIRWRM